MTNILQLIEDGKCPSLERMNVRLATDMKCAGDDDGSGGPQPMGIPLGPAEAWGCRPA